MCVCVYDSVCVTSICDSYNTTHTVLALRIQSLSHSLRFTLGKSTIMLALFRLLEADRCVCVF